MHISTPVTDRHSAAFHNAHHCRSGQAVRLLWQAPHCSCAASVFPLDDVIKAQEESPHWHWLCQTLPWPFGQHFVLLLHQRLPHSSHQSLTSGPFFCNPISSPSCFLTTSLTHHQKQGGRGATPPPPRPPTSPPAAGAPAPTPRGRGDGPPPARVGSPSVTRPPAPAAGSHGGREEQAGPRLRTGTPHRSYPEKPGEHEPEWYGGPRPPWTAQRQ